MSESDKHPNSEIELSRQPGISVKEYEIIRQKAELILLVISDTHGQIGFVQEALNKAEPVDLILHLGDHAADIGLLRDVLGKPIITVRGNCDGFGRMMPPEILVFDLAGCRVVMTHGHNKVFEVKRDLEKARRFTVSPEIFPDILLFGHTHSYHDETICRSNSNTRLLNPGSCSCRLSAIKVHLNAGTIEDVTRMT